MNSTFIDIHIAVSVDATELAGLLADNGMMGLWEQDGVIHLYWDHTTWDVQILDRIHEALQQLGVSLHPDQIAVNTVPWQDWNATWTKSVQPIQIGQRIIVRPSWTTLDLPEKSIELIIDPRQAFGTGHHLTTQLLVEWLESCIQGQERVVDIGTGSGILAMVALRLGAQFALGVDCDSAAIECAKDYARGNHFGPELELRAMDISSLCHDSFDLILANIDRRTLLANHQLFTKISTPHTVLLLSGILETDQDEIVTRYAEMGWRCVETRVRGEWVAIRLQRAQ